MNKERALKGINERVSWIREQAAYFSDYYCHPDQSGIRDLYRANHPTAIIACGCMDGRANIVTATGIPVGITKSINSLGGYFDIGWPYLSEIVNEWVYYNSHKGRQCLILITYHCSAHGNDRGCAGFNFDANAACDFTWQFKKQLEEVFGKKHSLVYPVIFGIETDEEVFTLISDRGEIRLKDYLSHDEAVLKKAVEDHYPNMQQVLLNDLMPLITGNINHAKEIIASHRPVVDCEHHEWIVAFGEDPDWLNEPNLALSIGPYGFNLSEQIVKAVEIIRSNMNAGKVGNDGFVLLCSATYRNISSYHRTAAIQQAKSLEKFAVSVIKQHLPDMAEKMKLMTGTVYEKTKKFTEV